MWGFASTANGSIGSKDRRPNSVEACAECSDDETSTVGCREEGLECPICWESFNIVENVPYVLWCGHTLCKNCVLGLQWAVVKFPTLPVQLPLFISCPWCNMLSFRLVCKGNLNFPRNNFFLLWMVENMNGERSQSYAPYSSDQNVTTSYYLLEIEAVVLMILIVFRVSLHMDLKEASDVLQLWVNI